MRIVEQILGLRDRREGQADRLTFAISAAASYCFTTEATSGIRRSRACTRCGLVASDVSAARSGRPKASQNLAHWRVGDDADEDLLAVAGLEHIVDRPAASRAGIGDTDFCVTAACAMCCDTRKAQFS